MKCLVYLREFKRNLKCEAGSSFGELALLYFAPRAVAHSGASVGCLYNVSCYVLLSSKMGEMEIRNQKWRKYDWKAGHAFLHKATITATADAVVWVTARQQFKELLMKVSWRLTRRLVRRVSGHHSGLSYFVVASCEVPKLVPIQVCSALL